MQLKNSSRDGSRRSRAGRPAAALLAVALVALGSAPAPAQAVELSLATRASTLLAHVSFRWDRMSELTSSLRAGMESRITFTVRLYEKKKRIVPFTGDRLVTERTVARSAFWDFLDGSCVVESENGQRLSYAGTEELLQGFFTLAELDLPGQSSAERSRLYVTARAQFEPVRLMPPLSLVSLTGRAATSTTPWVRQEAP